MAALPRLALNVPSSNLKPPSYHESQTLSNNEETALLKIDGDTTGSYPAPMHNKLSSTMKRMNYCK